MNFKNLSLLIVSVFTAYSAYSQWKPITSNVPENAAIKLISSDESQTTVSVSLSGFFLKSINTHEGQKQILSLLNGTPILKKGAPDLPKLTSSIIISNQNNTKIEVLSSDFTNYQNIEIAPSKGNLKRDINPTTVEFTYGLEYRQNSFFPKDIVELRDPYILRDFRGQTLIVNPFQYNPILKTLKVYHNIVIKISSTTEKGINELSSSSTKSITKEFGEIYKKQFINFNSQKYTAIPEGGKMLIISHNSFLSAMQPYVNWKKQIGTETEIVDIATIGTTPTAIKNYMINYFNNKNLSYLLFVGDAIHIPPFNSSYGDSDNSYAYILGSDHYPEFFVGRFSAESIAHVQTQVNRTINYEKAIIANGNWLEKGITIASNQGPGDDNEYDYAHQRNIRTDLLGYNYSATSELYDGNQGGVDATGNPTAVMVSAELNEGRGVITYTGHGSDNSFVSSGFSSSDVTNLTNENMLPFIWSVACVNGNFDGQTCFAEAWLRASKNGNPTGAVATLMSTINQSWDPPMCGQDEMVDIFVESYANNIKRTFGGISMNGCMKMNDEYGAAGDEITDTWTVFGDPSLMLRSKVPTSMVVSHVSSILLGSNSLLVNCDVDDALVSLTINNEIIGTGIVSSGSASINFPALANIDTISVTITSYNKIPYFGNVQIIPPVGPYVVLNNFSVNDALGNNNSFADYNETFALNVNLQNIGVSQADSVYARISSTDSYVTINNNDAVWGDILNGTNSTQNSVYNISVVDGVPDYHFIPIEMSVNDKNGNNWISMFNIRANAPAFTIGDYIIDDASGNNNGIFDPGENINLIIQNTNTGHAIAHNCNAVISCASTYLTINTPSVYIDSIIPANQENVLLSITADSFTPIGTSVTLNYSITSGLYTESKSIDIIIGLIPDYLMSNSTVTACVGTFMDASGTNDYTVNQNFTMTFIPGGANNALQFDFSNFSTEAGFDYLYIYDGNSTSSPQIQGSPFHGTNSPGSIIASNSQGAFTFKFTSDSYINGSGWVANFQCVDLSIPPQCVTNFTPADNDSLVNPSSLLSWNAVSGATSYDIYIGTSLPLSLIQNVNTTSYNASLLPNTQYYWKIVPKNLSGVAIGCSEWSFSTIDAPTVINMNNGVVVVENALFYDSGGSTSAYLNDEEYTLTFQPASRNGKVKVVFNTFNVESGYDFLYVYDGSNVSSNQFAGSPYTGSTLPSTGGEFLAANSSGALTFKFTSDYMVTQSGWAAIVSVEESTVNVDENTIDKSNKGIEIYPNPAKDVLNIDFFNQIVNPRIEIQNVQGKTLQTLDLSHFSSSNQLKVNLRGLISGIYILRINNNNSLLVKKLIIK